ncbi:UNVERIFIED_CONTAM: hypothetical protein RMT77_006745 [Armadillidium vulgare]
MKAIIQRVQKSYVSISGEVVSSIGPGLCVLVGIHKEDKQQDIDYIVRKILNIRLFEDGGKRWQKSVKDLNEEVLCVSQFTLYSKLKGNKPDYSQNMGGDEAKSFYEQFLSSMKNNYCEEKVKDGKFGAMMQVSLVNDGPVTITLESPKSPQIDPEI